jgi:hypothetical protein
MPVTTPVTLTFAIVADELAHVPPATLLVNAIEAVLHTVPGPDIVPVFGSGKIVAVTVV